MKSTPKLASSTSLLVLGIPATSPPRTRSAASEDLREVFTFPTAGRFLAQFGVVPVNLPWEDIEVAVQTGELDGDRLVGHHRRLHRGLGRRDQLLPDQQHLGRLGRVVLCQHGSLERIARRPANAVPRLL